MTDVTRPIEAYLQSEQAMMDVGTVIAEPRTISRNIDGRCYVLMEEEIWRRLELCVRITESDKWEVMRAYFRPDGDRYIVTDLGEGLRTYALRTGDIEYRGFSRQPISGIHDRDGRLYACRTRNDSLCLGMEAAELPGAICRVLLAAYRVANVEPTTHREDL